MYTFAAELLAAEDWDNKEWFISTAVEVLKKKKTLEYSRILPGLFFPLILLFLNPKNV